MSIVFAIYLLIVWLTLPSLCLYLFFKVKSLTKAVEALSASQKATLDWVDGINSDVEELWDAVFPDHDPDDEEEIDEEPTNVVAFGRKVA